MLHRRCNPACLFHLQNHCTGDRLLVVVVVGYRKGRERTVFLQRPHVRFTVTVGWTFVHTVPVCAELIHQNREEEGIRCGERLCRYLLLKMKGDLWFRRLVVVAVRRLVCICVRY